MANDATSFWKSPWTLRAPAFAIADNLYYVGNANVSCHLIRAEQGLILIDTAFAQTTYLLTESIRSLGFDPCDIRMIIHSHGHVDHCGATRRMKELSGATVALGEADVQAVEQGTPMTCAEYLYGMPDFETFTVDRSLRHGDTIDLGDPVIHCHHTPGHSPGVMTYTFDVTVDGRRCTAGLFGGAGLWPLADAHREAQGYPGNREDFAEALKCLATLPVDLWLGAHPGQNGTFEKHRRLLDGETPNPFLDPEGWRRFVARLESDFGAMRGA